MIMKNEKLIDMHTHTIYSDGDLAPRELIELAISKNIGILAITDHDTIEGIKQEIKKQAVDNTEIIRKKVLDWLDSNSLLYHRIKNAFPKFEVYDRVVEKIRKRKNI